MEFTKKADVTIDGYTFQVREMTIAVKEEIDRSRAQGGFDVVRETIKRCVWYDGKALGDDAGNMGFSFATPLIMKIQELSGAGVDPAIIETVKAADEPAAVAPAAAAPGPAANGHAAAVDDAPKG